MRANKTMALLIFSLWAEPLREDMNEFECLERQILALKNLTHDKRNSTVRINDW